MSQAFHRGSALLFIRGRVQGQRTSVAVGGRNAKLRLHLAAALLALDIFGSGIRVQAEHAKQVATVKVRRRQLQQRLAGGLVFDVRRCAHS